MNCVGAIYFVAEVGEYKPFSHELPTMLSPNRTILYSQQLWKLWLISIRESPTQSENQIMAGMYVRSITRSTSILLAETGVWKISSVACGFSSIKIDYSDYPKSLISRINEVYVIFNKILL